MLKNNLDAVSIAVPTTLHKDIALKAANYGVHMLVEKPIAESLSSADAIIDAARRENLKLMVGHIERFNPAILKLKELISAGELGEIISISCRRVGPFPPRIRDVGIITHKIRKVTITATGGVAHADYLEQSLEIWKEGEVREGEIEKREPLKNELEYFMHAVVNGEEPSPSGEEGEYALYVAISAIESYEKGENIRLNLN